jgi:hypothetical protein
MLNIDNHISSNLSDLRRLLRTEDAHSVTSLVAHIDAGIATIRHFTARLVAYQPMPKNHIIVFKGLMESISRDTISINSEYSLISVPTPENVFTTRQAYPDFMELTTITGTPMMMKHLDKNQTSFNPFLMSTLHIRA